MSVNANTQIYDKVIDRAAMIRLYERRVNGKVELVLDGHAVKIDKLIRVVRQQDRNDRADDEPCRHEHTNAAQDNYAAAHKRGKHIVIAALPEINGPEDCFLDDIKIFIVEYQSQSKADHHDANGEQEQPSLELHPRIKPFQ